MNCKVHPRRGFDQLAGFLMLVAAFTAACSATEPTNQVRTSDSYRSAQVPKGWVDSYDYTAPLDSYLQRQATAAVAIDRKPLLYIFDDSFGDCRTFRRRANSGRFLDLFQNKYIIMLNHEFVHEQMRIAGKREGSGLDNVGVFVPLDQNGDAEGSVIDVFSSPSTYSRSIGQQIMYLERSFSALYDAEN